ncbi:MAG: Flp pilus assembly complex ATPase component TadA [Simkaniaceae bacterium]|nr:Flp pilus assembly complex ATPase component TadA [Simkaniaceae bacterium]
MIKEELTAYSFVPDVIPYSFAKERGVLPLKDKEGRLLIATSVQGDIELLNDLYLLLKHKVEEIHFSQEMISQAIETHYENGSAKTLLSEMQEDEGEEVVEEGYELFDKTEESPIIRSLNAMIIEAVQQGASDIHFEPGDQGLVVRYRIDGVLQTRHIPSKEYQKQMITRIKVMAKLDIAQQRLPQDGRIKLFLSKREIDLRVSTVPIVHGERVVLRILDRNKVILGLEEIGMPPDLLTHFRKTIHKTQGIILVTGPTGSGKTSTLYSALSEINSSEVNVMTIEDPVEYKMENMAQMGVNPKIHLTFAKGLRHILRQDPDVIMIGEIRDVETAEIAIQASLTGHLVLSTLHTNSAPAAVTRLIDMGIEPYLISSSVIGVLAQRLLRTLCLDCREAYYPTDEEIEELGIVRKDLKNGSLFRAKGCEACYRSGYRGRHGIYEWMEVDEKVKLQMLKSGDATGIASVANYISLRERGAFLAIEGITSTAEVLRVTR